MKNESLIVGRRQLNWQERREQQEQVLNTNNGQLVVNVPQTLHKEVITINEKIALKGVVIGGNVAIFNAVYADMPFESGEDVIGCRINDGVYIFQTDGVSQSFFGERAARAAVLAATASEGSRYEQIYAAIELALSKVDNSISSIPEDITPALKALFSSMVEDEENISETMFAFVKITPGGVLDVVSLSDGGLSIITASGSEEYLKLGEADTCGRLITGSARQVLGSPKNNIIGRQLMSGDIVYVYSDGLDQYTIKVIDNLVRRASWNEVAAVLADPVMGATDDRSLGIYIHT